MLHFWHICHPFHLLPDSLFSIIITTHQSDSGLSERLHFPTLPYSMISAFLENFGFLTKNHFRKLKDSCEKIVDSAPLFFLNCFLGQLCNRIIICQFISSRIFGKMMFNLLIKQTSPNKRYTFFLYWVVLQKYSRNVFTVEGYSC